jgi:hypothetical protein
MVFMPMFSAQPSSASMRWESNVEACHISAAAFPGSRAFGAAISITPQHS